MKTKIYEARKQHVSLHKQQGNHIQLQAFIERLNNGMSIEEAIKKPRDYRGAKYKQFVFKAHDDLGFVKEVIQRMQQDGNPTTTAYEREKLGLIKAKHGLPTNTSLYKLLSFLKNAHYSLSTTQKI